jgi:hypothetical protein
MLLKFTPSDPFKCFAPISRTSVSELRYKFKLENVVVVSDEGTFESELENEYVGPFELSVPFHRKKTAIVALLPDPVLRLAQGTISIWVICDPYGTDERLTVYESTEPGVVELTCVVKPSQFVSFTRV